MARAERRAYNIVTPDPTISFAAFRAARYNAFFWTWKAPERAHDLFDFSPEHPTEMR